MTRPASRLDDLYDPVEHHDLERVEDQSTVGLPSFVPYCHCGWWSMASSRQEAKHLHNQHRDKPEEHP
jgi:hypothetical protein